MSCPSPRRETRRPRTGPANVRLPPLCGSEDAWFQKASAACSTAEELLAIHIASLQDAASHLQLAATCTIGNRGQGAGGVQCVDATAADALRAQQPDRLEGPKLRGGLVRAEAAAAGQLPRMHRLLRVLAEPREDGHVSLGAEQRVQYGATPTGRPSPTPSWRSAHVRPNLWYVCPMGRYTLRRNGPAAAMVTVNTDETGSLAGGGLAFHWQREFQRLLKTSIPVRSGLVEACPEGLSANRGPSAGVAANEALCARKGRQNRL